MDIISLLVGLVLLALIGYAVYHKIRRNEQDFSHLYQPVDENLLDSSEEFEGVLAFSGEGEFRTQVFQLERGRYKLTYQFPDTKPVKVELFSASGDDSAVIVIKKGEGSESFSIGTPGRYFCIVEPAANNEEWLIEISPLGLPSQRSEQAE